MIEPIEMNVDFSTQDTELNVEADMNCRVEIPLPIASAITLGGIKVGDNLSITEDGTLSADGSEEEIEQLQEDVDQLKNALTTKAEQDGAYPDLTAGQVLSKVEQTDSVPYNFRAVGQDATLEYTDAIVGGSVAWNQLVKNIPTTTNNNIVFTNNGDGSYTVSGSFTSAGQAFVNLNYTANTIAVEGNHKYCVTGVNAIVRMQIASNNGIIRTVSSDSIISIDSLSQSITATWARLQTEATSALQINTVVKPQLYDLTAMFGSTIADYIYSLEQANAGTGAAWFKKLFPNDYYEYNAGEIVSVQGLSAHKTTGKNLLPSFTNTTGHGLTLTVDSEGVCTIYGTISDSSPVLLGNQSITLPAGSYTLSDGTDNINAMVQIYNATTGVIIWRGGGDTLTFTYNGTDDLRARIWVRGATTFNDVKLYPMIRLASVTDATYVPYASHTYPLDSTKTFRGIFKLDSNNQLYADGDRYLPDGTVQRRYGVVDLGTFNWTSSTYEQGGYSYFRSGSFSNWKNASYPNFICSKYLAARGRLYMDADKTIAPYTPDSYEEIFVRDDSFTDAATFKSAMSGVYLVYELATPTTEEAEPYTNPQIVDPNGTEEYVSTSIVPVGHESRYPLDIAGRLDKILTMPTANGTYTLRATVNNGAVSYAWVST